MIRSELSKLLPIDLIKRYQVIPLGEEGQALIVGMAVPLDLQATDDLSLLTGKTIIPREMAKEEIALALKRFILDSSSLLGDEPGEKHYPYNQVGGLVDLVLAKAVNEGASDVHFEPEEKGWRVRFRIDGILLELIRPQVENYPGIISRLKILAGLDISKKREPLEGRFQQTIAGRQYDFRLVTMPALYGEKAVLRVLNKETIGFTLDKLGFSADNLTKTARLLAHPQGLILVTGPTGSGKTTTLYAILQKLLTSEKSITTLEDPIEYTLPGITQVAVNQDEGLSYVACLKALLRQDPDIIMIGEIRDQETARIALRAALTGHTVLATLHTINAPQAISRLLDLEVEPFLIKSSLIGVISQRLIRVKCPCLQGCPKCHFTAYNGRTSVQEVLEITPALERQINVNFAEQSFIAEAEKEGYQSLILMGKGLYEQGITDGQELARVIYCP
jgi:type IV pilus assembly protein PilB